MIGEVVNPPRTFDFGQTAAGQTSVIELGTYDLAGVRNAGLAVRIHSAHIGTGASMSIKAYGAWPWPNDQLVQFSDSTPFGNVFLDHALDNTTGAFKSGSLTSIAAPFVRLTAEGSQPGGGAVNLSATITVGLELYSA